MGSRSLAACSHHYKTNRNDATAGTLPTPPVPPGHMEAPAWPLSPSPLPGPDPGGVNGVELADFEFDGTGFGFLGVGERVLAQLAVGNTSIVVAHGIIQV